jgi:hypothetical protein
LALATALIQAFAEVDIRSPIGDDVGGELARQLAGNIEIRS